MDGINQVSIILSSFSLADVNLICTSNNKPKILKSFDLKDFFSKTWSKRLDGRLLDKKKLTSNSVKYFITNECDNGFTFSFPIKAWRKLADGKIDNIRAKVDYGYPGLVGEDETMTGTAIVHCEVD